MGNTYTSPTLSGYNANAPPDDGSQSSDNEITWAKHKSKIGDPLKTYAEAIDSATQSAFAKRFLNAVTAISSDYTVQSSDRGKLISATNTITITLLAAGTAGDGWAIAIRNDGSGTVTVDGNGSETINGSATVDLNPGGWLVLTSDGTNWSATDLPIIDEDDMSSDSDSHVPTQQSVKAYIDGKTSPETPVATTSGSTVDFTGISGANRLTILFNEVSFDAGAIQVAVKIGDTDGLETSGYVSSTTSVNNNGNITTLSSTSDFRFIAGAASDAVSGAVILTRITGNTWLMTLTAKRSTTVSLVGGGSKTLSKELDRIQIDNSVVGSNAFDGGSIGLIVE